MEMAIGTKKAYKQQVRKEKQKLSNKIAKAKEDYKEKKRDLKIARLQGYSDGVRRYDTLPKRKGAISKAKTSYGKGLKDCKKSEDLKHKINVAKK